MIQARDLRVGNLISCEREDDGRQFVNKIGEAYGRQLIHEVYQIFETSIQCIDEDGGYYRHQLSCCEGIPLTPEWLTKCGFEKANVPPNYCGNQPVFEKCLNKVAKRWLVLAEYHAWLPNIIEGHDYFSGAAIEADIQYVHHLQNLWMAIAGQELEIK